MANQIIDPTTGSLVITSRLRHPVAVKPQVQSLTAGRPRREDLHVDGRGFG